MAIEKSFLNLMASSAIGAAGVRNPEGSIWANLDDSSSADTTVLWSSAKIAEEIGNSTAPTSASVDDGTY